MAWQLTQSTYKDLSRYVMQTHKILLQLKEANISSRQRYLAVKMAFQLKAAAKYLLLDDLQNREESIRQNKAVLQYRIGNQENSMRSPLCLKTWPHPFNLVLQTRLEAIVQESAWRDDANSVLKYLVHGLNRGLPFSESPSVGVPKFAYDILVGTGRAAALEELEMQVRDANKWLLREPDLVTVYLEFNGLTEVDSQRLFGLSKFELGRVIYSRIREKMEYENPPVVQFETERGAYEPSAPELLSTKTFFLRWGDGLFFMFFMALNLGVVLPTGVGPYTSIHMTGTQTQIIAIAMISFSSPLSFSHPLTCMIFDYCEDLIFHCCWSFQCGNITSRLPVPISMEFCTCVYSHHTLHFLWFAHRTSDMRSGWTTYSDRP